MMTQTIDSKGDRILPTKKFLLDRFWVWLTGIGLWVVGALFLAMFAPIREQVSAIWRAPQALAALSVQVAALRSDLNSATGDNRVIRQPAGLTYVQEPVHIGDPVTLNLVMSRTKLGEKCVFISGQSLFTEAGGIITPGSSVKPSRQVGEEITRLRIKLTQPDTLRPGRIELYLALEYECDERRVFDRTDTVTYSLLEKEVRKK